MLTLHLPIRKKEKNDKANYRTVIILPSLSKIYEKSIYQQLYDNFDSILSPKQCGFHKGLSATEVGLYSLTFLIIK